MNLKLLLLHNGVYLISLVEELEYEPKCHLEKPYEVGGKTTIILTSWPKHTSDEHIMLHSTSILTIVDCNENLRAAYLNKIGITLDELTKMESRVMLLEDDSEAPDYPPESEYLEENPTDFY